VGEFELIVATLKEPYRAMVYIAQCLGLRVSEIAALQWDDFDFEKSTAQSVGTRSATRTARGWTRPERP